MGLINAGRASDVGPGEIKAFTVAGRELAVANLDGEFYAFDNWCTHEACTFSDEGELEDGKLVCTCHFGEFDLATGDVLGGPPWEPLGVYELAVEGDDLLIDPRIDDSAAS